MTVTFYDDSDNSVIGVVENIQNHNTASLKWSDLDEDTSYSWYTVIDDGEVNVTSDTWSFTTKGEEKVTVDIEGFNRKSLSFEVSSLVDSSVIDVNWTVSVSGGIFGMMNFSCSGVIDNLGAGSKVNVNSDDFGFGIGSVDVTVEVYVNNSFCSKIFSGFMLGRSIFVFPGGK
jgi:hypothetical protein